MKSGKALVTQLSPTLCEPMDCSPPSSSVRGILQARILGVSCSSLLQGIFPTQGFNPGLLNCKQIGTFWATMEAQFQSNVTWSFLSSLIPIFKSVFSLRESPGPWWYAAAAAKSLQLCLTLCDPTDRSLPGSPVPGILQAKTLEWVAISFSNAWKWKVKVKSLSHVWLLATPWIAAYQAPPSMGFSRQEYWSGVPLPSPTDDF